MRRALCGGVPPPDQPVCVLDNPSAPPPRQRPRRRCRSRCCRRPRLQLSRRVTVEVTRTHSDPEVSRRSPAALIRAAEGRGRPVQVLTSPRRAGRPVERPRDGGVVSSAERRGRGARHACCVQKALPPPAPPARARGAHQGTVLAAVVAALSREGTDKGRDVRIVPTMQIHICGGEVANTNTSEAVNTKPLVRFLKLKQTISNHKCVFGSIQLIRRQMA